MVSKFELNFCGRDSGYTHTYHNKKRHQLIVCEALHPMNVSKAELRS